ncbi:MAG TPA: glucosyl-3-phosphoglycerate synthase [Solirubrobacteraceae bacterium]|jgi:glucosyl-3-phosphoglycerate synthase|nr:glucosyl-3-phosphoglycerate synthase [Solirubrobacteraceae bacterium]
MRTAPAASDARARTFHHSLYSAARIAAARRGAISVCLPARECAGTVGEIVARLLPLREQGAIDEIVVVDAASPDGTAEVARRAGATVHQEAELLPEFGAVLGKGDAMWRALSILRGELVCFLDADTEGFSAHFCTGLLGPLVCEPRVQFVKGCYRRPFEHGGVSLPEGGGRVNHLTARPALALFYPELAWVRQPLAGEVAAPRALLQRLPFATGYGVEIAMLIDAWHELGGDGLAQVDLDVHRNRHQPLHALTPMAHTVLATIARRLQREGRLREGEGDGRTTAARPAAAADRATLEAAAPPSPVERPPLASLGAAR